MRFVAPLAALALSACVTVYPPDEPADELAYARIGESIRVDGHTITPLGLLEDSRCPHGVQCVWAGRVRITARVDTTPLQLTMGEPHPIGRAGSVTLVSVEPRRLKDAPPSPPEYRFGFRLAG